MITEQKEFKDKCEKCGNFDYLKGINGKCLCQNCINEMESKKINNLEIANVEIQLSMFDLDGSKKCNKNQDTFTLFTNG